MSRAVTSESALMHSEKGKFLAFDQKLISKSSLHPHSSVVRTQKTPLISQEPPAAACATVALLEVPFQA